MPVTLPQSKSLFSSRECQSTHGNGAQHRRRSQEGFACDFGSLREILDMTAGVEDRRMEFDRQEVPPDAGGRTKTNIRVIAP